MNGINTVIKKPTGRIKIIKNHKTSRGVMFRVGEIYDQYGVFTTNSGCNCGDNKPNKSFRVKGGTIPYEKAVIVP
jgi:hypothetical protein